jgi:hypothetical protein
MGLAAQGPAKKQKAFNCGCRHMKSTTWYLRGVEGLEHGQGDRPEQKSVTTACHIRRSRGWSDMERTSAQIWATTSLALASGRGKGSRRDRARAIAGGVGSLISITVTNGLPLRNMAVTAACSSVLDGCARECT